MPAFIKRITTCKRYSVHPCKVEKGYSYVKDKFSIYDEFPYIYWGPSYHCQILAFLGNLFDVNLFD